MNTKMKIQIRTHLVKVFFTLLMIVMAGPLAIGQGSGPGPDPGGSPDVPLEGGDYLLLAMGAGYVIIKLWQYQYKKKSQQQHIIKLK